MPCGLSSQANAWLLLLAGASRLANRFSHGLVTAFGGRGAHCTLQAVAGGGWRGPSELLPHLPKQTWQSLALCSVPSKQPAVVVVH